MPGNSELLRRWRVTPQILQRHQCRGKQVPRSLIQEAQFLHEVSLGHMNWEQTPAELRPVWNRIIC